MALLISFAVASVAALGLAIFLFRYRGTRARLPGLSAFALGLAVLAVFILIHVTVGPEHRGAASAFFTCHVAMCMVEFLLLGAVMSLRDPPSAAYRRTEYIKTLILAAVAVILYGGVARWAPHQQDQVLQLIFFTLPLLVAVAVAARFELRRDGLVGCSVFLALFVSGLTHFLTNPYEREGVVLRTTVDVLTMAGYIGIPVFFFLAANNADLARRPWPGGSMTLNRMRLIYSVLMAVCIEACGLFFTNQNHNGWLADWGSTNVPLRPLLSAAAFAGCLAAVFGLTTGRNVLARRPKN